MRWRLNFLLHFRLAQRDLGDDAAALGAMLPDLWRMAARPARARRDPGAADAELRSVQRGVAHHLEADRWFHRSRFFSPGERATAASLAGTQLPRASLFGHIVWEMCLDGALIRHVGLDELQREVEGAIRGREGLAARVGDLHHGDARLRAGVSAQHFELRMRRLFLALSSFELPEGYAHARGVAVRLAGVRSALGLPAVDGEIARWAEAVAPIEPLADAMIGELLAAPFTP
jgi:hypothetical protein